MAKEYGVGFQVPSPTSRDTIYPAITKANESLQREPLQDVMISLLQRKYPLLLQADTIFAFGSMERNCKMFRGGTGWCVQMAMDLGKTIYVYDPIDNGTWFQEKHKRFRLKADLPILPFKSVILGSKHIGPFTNNEIQRLFHRTFSTHLQDLAKSLEEFDL